jgi:inward rectifier potassium channel
MADKIRILHAKARTTVMPIRSGAFEVSKTGLEVFDWRDLYHFAVTLSWPWFFVALVAAEGFINLIFATLYSVRPGCIANAGPGSLVDAFFFSIETLATVGYGTMVPVTLYGHIVSAIEIITGMVFTAVVTGLIFVRFSRPRAKITFAESCVVARDHGDKTLMVRIGNGRATLLVDAHARLTLLLKEHTPEGVPFRRIHDLALVRNHFPLFALTWTIAHRVNEHSPLAGLDHQTLKERDARIFLTVEARDPSLGAVVFDIQGYDLEHVLFDTRYVDTVSWDEEGRTTADMSRISSVEPDPAAYAV